MRLYTIGHSDHPIERFLDLLRAHQVHTLVDVRSAPYSRFVPHFNKRELEAVLTQQGSAYRFAGQYLGGRPTQADLYKGGALPDDDTARDDFVALVDYEAVMRQDWYLRGIHRLLELVTEGSAAGEHVAIMCSEGDPRNCHRHHLITRSLLDPSVRVAETAVEVAHILHDGGVDVVDVAEFQQPRQLSLF